MTKAYIETYGCTFNQGDSQLMKGALSESGFSLVASPKEADIIILNTCTVKSSTEQKILYRIRELSTRFPKKRMIIAGCMVETNGNELLKAAPRASWVGPLQIGSIGKACGRVMKGEVVRLVGKSGLVKAGALKVRDNAAIAIVQICEGCLGACSFCATRFARGTLFSYPPECVIGEIRDAVKNGAKEIQLTAQDTGAYGKDIGKNLPYLLRKIDGIEGRFFVRLGMINPEHARGMKNELIKCFESKKMYKFLHIPIQSGNDEVLRNMRRRSSVSQFKSIVKAFRKRFPDMAIATDIIVGFPGESESAFEDTMALIEEIRPDVVNVSRFTPRGGTEAKRMKQLPSRVIKDRSERMSALCRRIAKEKNEKRVGSRCEVLVTEKQKTLTGRDENYRQVALVKGNAKIGEFVRARITGTGGGCLLGIIE